MRGREGALKDSIIHFALAFPESYPQEAPQVLLFQAVPHPNVVLAPHVDIRYVEAGAKRPEGLVRLFDLHAACSVLGSMLIELKSSW